MAQLLFMGASIEYGVGGVSGGWADRVKLALHHQMYDGDSNGEAHEVHIFAKPDATLDFVAATYKDQVAQYRREGRPTVIVLSIGMNDTKAVDAPGNYLNTPEAYGRHMAELVQNMLKQVDYVIGVGFTPVDEAKTNPKINPFTGKNSYFTNGRIEMFNKAFADAVLAQNGNVTFVDLLGKVPSEWSQEYLAGDGVHPNDRGHQFIFDHVFPALTALLGSQAQGK